jgi:sirohydrochlorin cobaltochelatase
LRALNRFSAVRSAFLEEEPSLEHVIKRMPGPAVVAGLFAGQGLHGAEDVPRLIAGLRRPNVAFAGNVGSWDIADAVAEAVRRVDRAPTVQGAHPRQ